MDIKKLKKFISEEIINQKLNNVNLIPESQPDITAISRLKPNTKGSLDKTRISPDTKQVLNRDPRIPVSIQDTNKIQDIAKLDPTEAYYRGYLRAWNTVRVNIAQLKPVLSPEVFADIESRVEEFYTLSQRSMHEDFPNSGLVSKS